MSTTQAAAAAEVAAQVAQTAGEPGAAGSRRPGRPRSERAEQAIIDAALSLFAESGPDGLCIERVAARTRRTGSVRRR